MQAVKIAIPVYLLGRCQ